MTNIIGSHKGMRYFQVPESFVSSGDLRDLSGSAVKLYTFLLREMNRTGQVELEYTNQDIFDHTGIDDHRTAKTAREELQSKRRVNLRKGPSGGFIYAVLDDCGNVLTAAPGRKSVRLRIPKEKPFSKSADDSRAITPRRAEIQSPVVAAPLSPVEYCRVHRRITGHWMRDGQPLCQECHPNPTPQKATFRPPTAKELGFS